MRGKPLRINRGRSHNHFQIRSARQQALQVTQQKIDIQTTLVCFINDQRVVRTQVTITLCFRQQNAIGHQLDIGVTRYLVREAHLVAHGLPQRALQLLRDARRHRARGDAPWLCMANKARDAALQFQTDFRQLGGLARPGFAADNDDLIFTNRARDFIPHRHHGQIIRVSRLRQIGEPFFYFSRGASHGKANC